MSKENTCSACGESKDSCKKKECSGFKLGLVALAAGAAAGYFLYGEKSIARRKKVKGWMLKAKGEVLEKIERLKDIDEDKYNEIVDSMTLKYKKLKSIDSSDVDTLASDLKKQWKKINRDINSKVKSNKKSPKKKVAKK